MRAIFAGAVLLMAASAANAEEQNDEVVFLGTTSEKAWMEHFPTLPKNFAQNPKFEGADQAFFGVSVKDLFNREQWYRSSCADLLKDNGATAIEAMKDVLQDRDAMRMYPPFEYVEDEPVNLESMKTSVDKAVSNAIAQCAPKMM